MQRTDQQLVIRGFIQHKRRNGVIEARAGTGKTTTIVDAVEHARPFSKILCCAFNRRIRDKLEREIRALNPSDQGKDVAVMTLHQLGRRTLSAFRNFRAWQHDDQKDRRAAEAALTNTRFNDTDEGRKDRSDVVDRVKTAASLVKACWIVRREDLVETIYGFGLDTNYLPAEELASLTATAVKMALDMWPATSFDDEIWIPVHYGLRLGIYDMVLIDECQDLSLTQLRLAQSAVHVDGRVIAVGDPAQAIYGWRGADANAVARIVRELEAEVLPLSVSFRCPKKVVELAKRHVKDIVAAPNAPEGKVENIDLGRMLTEVRSQDFVVSRTNAPLVQVALNLVRNRVAARVIGQDIGRMLTGMIQRSRAQTVPQLLAWITEWETEEVERLTKAKRARAIDNAHDKADTLREFCDDKQEIAEVLREIDGLFVEDKSQYVVCSTVHRLKGDEANRVFVLEETFFLQRGDPVEEANIHYVAITRSKRELYRVRGLYKRRQSEEPVAEISEAR